MKRLKWLLFVTATAIAVFLWLVIFQIMQGLNAYSYLPEYNYVVLGGVVLGILSIITVDVLFIVVDKFVDGRLRKHERAEDR